MYRFGGHVDDGRLSQVVARGNNADLYRAHVRMYEASV